MLPNLAGLDLAAHEAARTGEFYALSDDEARDLGIDPITFEAAEAGRGREHPNATFRVRDKDPKPDGTYRYTFFKAAGLWDWVNQQERARNPLTNEPIWREDWWELWERFHDERPAAGRQPDGMPSWVRHLPRRDPTQPDLHTYYGVGMGGGSRRPPHDVVEPEPEPEPPVFSGEVGDAEAVRWSLERYENILTGGEEPSFVVDRLKHWLTQVWDRINTFPAYAADVFQTRARLEAFIQAIAGTFRRVVQANPAGHGAELVIMTFLAQLWPMHPWTIEILADAGLAGSMEAFIERNAPGGMSVLNPHYAWNPARGLVRNIRRTIELRAEAARAEADRAERRRAEIEAMRASLLQEDWDKIRQYWPTFDSMTPEQQYSTMRNTRDLRVYGPEDDLWG